MSGPTGVARGWRARLAGLVEALVGAGVTLGLVAWGLYAARDFLVDAYRGMFWPPISWTKLLGASAVGLVLVGLLLTPLAWLERRADAAFARAEAALRRTRPEAVVTPYEGPLGRGLRFDTQAGPLLLLRAPGGVGEPRVVEVPAGT